MLFCFIIVLIVFFVVLEIGLIIVCFFLINEFNKFDLLMFGWLIIVILVWLVLVIFFWVGK